MKPICCGDRRDAELLLAASSTGLTIDELNPTWLRTPAAPFSAALIEGVEIDVSRLLAQLAELQKRFDLVVVEGVGGWLVPIAHGFTVADLAAELGLPIAVVVANRLGALNHAALTFEAIRHRGISCAGLILNHPTMEDDRVATATNRASLEELVKLPILFEVAHGQRELRVRLT